MRQKLGAVVRSEHRREGASAAVQSTFKDRRTTYAGDAGRERKRPLNRRGKTGAEGP